MGGASGVAGEGAVVLACTSSVFCDLSVHVNKREKKTTRCVGERLSEKRKTFGCFNSLLMSDLMNHKAIWSNYRRIDIELFKEVFNHARYHIVLFSLLFQIIN